MPRRLRRTVRRHRHWTFATAPVVMLVACSHSDPAVSADLQLDLNAASAPTAPGARSVEPLPDECRAFAAALVPVGRTPIDSARAVWTRDRGILAASQGDLVAARTALQESTRIDPSDPSAQYTLGAVSERLHDHAGATRAYCGYLSLGSPDRATAVRQRLHEIRAAEDVAIAASLVRRGNAPARLVVASARPSTHRTARDDSPVAYQAPLAPSPAIGDGRTDGSTTETSRGTLERETPPAAVPVPAPVPAPVPVASPESVGVSASVPRPPERVVSSAPQPPAAPDERPSARSTVARDAVVGAGLGAILGTMIGRNARSAVIGGIAGVVLGGAVGASSASSQPVPRPRRYRRSQ